MKQSSLHAGVSRRCGRLQRKVEFLNRLQSWNRRRVKSVIGGRRSYREERQSYSQFGPAQAGTRDKSNCKLSQPANGACSLREVTQAITCLRAISFITSRRSRG